MTVKIPCEPEDNQKFLSVLNGFVTSLTIDIEPAEVYAIRINQWFDKKWLGYSGKGIVQLPYGEPYVLARLDKQFLDHLTFPPFNPQEVTAEHYWKIQKRGTYGSIDKPHFVYNKALKHNTYNWFNLVESVTNSGIFVWFSSNTETSGQGSVMVYSVKGADIQTKYVALREDSDWEIGNEIFSHNKTKNELPCAS